MDYLNEENMLLHCYEDEVIDILDTIKNDADDIMKVLEEFVNRFKYMQNLRTAYNELNFLTQRKNSKDSIIITGLYQLNRYATFQLTWDDLEIRKGVIIVIGERTQYFSVEAFEAMLTIMGV